MSERCVFFFFSSRRRHTRFKCDWSSDVCSSDPPEPFWFDGADGAKVQGMLVRPPHFDPAKKYPMLLLIHGGPQNMWANAWSYRWNPEVFAAPGYVAVMINPRGSTGYGQRFTDEIRDDWGGRADQDLMKGVGDVVGRYPDVDGLG